MSKSLQDQLLALGLAKEKARSSGRKPAPGKRENSRKSMAGEKTVHSNSELSLEAAYRLRNKQAKEQAKQSRERKRQEDRRRRQLNNVIRAIVQPNRLNDPKAELARNFMYKGRIRKVNVTADQLMSLNKGDTGLVYLSGGYHLLSCEHVAQIQELSADHVPELSVNDNYADEEGQFPVPDDLIW
jgi:uncharacterized protein YaiL (DUF2058 family)